jgi:hypothetical protein
VATPRPLFHILAGLLAILLLAAPATATPLLQQDPAYAVNDGSVQPQKQADHASRRLRPAASLEEFFEIDDDAEQYFKPPPILLRPTAGSALIAKSPIAPHQAAPPSHRACAAYPTGPPHA